MPWDMSKETFRLSPHLDMLKLKEETARLSLISPCWSRCIYLREKMKIDPAFADIHAY